MTSGRKSEQEENEWRGAIPHLLLEGLGMARKIIGLHIDAGEGAVLQRINHFIKTSFFGCDYGDLAGKAAILIGDAGDYHRKVNEFCGRVSDNWSYRANDQADYFSAFCKLLDDMACQLKTIIDHKAGIKSLDESDFNCALREFRSCYDRLVTIAQVMPDPYMVSRFSGAAKRRLTG